MERKLISNILEELASHDVEDKVTMLQAANSLPLRQILIAALDPAVTFDVTVPEYRENTEVDGYASNSLFVEYRRLYIFMALNKQVSIKRKEQILGQILESIDPKDAKLLEKIVQKDFSEYGLTPEIVNQAFPGLIKNLDQKK
jgi:hypothetical protein